MSSSPYFAAIDLGSNSFHMLIGRVNDGQLDVVDREKEMVQIARGLDDEGNLDAEARQRALDCLNRFAERLRNIPKDQVRAVGTKTLRSTKQSGDFLRLASKTLGHPIQIISGFEEARLVYCGLSHSIMNDHTNRLVIDIGGGSTEFIIGKDYDPSFLESLSLGCVAYTNQFFKGGNSLSESMNKAYFAACTELENIRKPYTKKGWDIAFGTSGTIKAICELVDQEGSRVISYEQLTQLMQDIMSKGGVFDKNIAKLRRDVLPAGVAILKAIFDQLKIEKLYAASASLKDGLIFDTVGRFSDDDVREQTVANLIKRHGIDIEHAERIKNTTLDLWSNIKSNAADIAGISRTKVLRWASQVHEIGLSISHSSHHHHGHYLLQHSDLAGFGAYEQYILANLVRFHRKKIKSDVYTSLNPEVQEGMSALIVCLRIAVLLCRKRDDITQSFKLDRNDQRYVLKIDGKWLELNPLTRSGLLREIELLKNIGANLSIEET